MIILVVASRFGLLLGLAMWLGLCAGLLLTLPTIGRQLPEGQGRELGAALVGRFDRMLLAAVALVLVGIGARVILDRAAPPTNLTIAVAVMGLSRLLSTFIVSPTARALLNRLRDANAPASDDERSAFARLQGARGLLQTLEVALGLYALYAVS